MRLCLLVRAELCKLAFSDLRPSPSVAELLPKLLRLCVRTSAPFGVARVLCLRQRERLREGIDFVARSASSLARFRSGMPCRSTSVSVFLSKRSASTARARCSGTSAGEVGVLERALVP